MAISLPTEIAQLILHALHPDSLDVVETALTVSSISWYWRAVALATPSLWATFSISLQKRSPLLPVFLQRSASAPLDVTISSDSSQSDCTIKAKVKNIDNLLCLHANRLQRLHLRFVAHTHIEHDLLTTFIRFQSSSLQYLEMEALQENETQRGRFLNLLLTHHDPTRCWSDRCPALTHITITNPECLLYSLTKIKYLCVKGVIRRKNGMRVNQAGIYDALARGTNLEELIVDGIPLMSAPNTIKLPHLRTLSLCSSPLPYGSTSPHDTSNMASFLLSLDTPALSSLAVPEPNTAIPQALGTSNIPLTRITRLAIVPSTYSSWLWYPTVLSAVEELVLLGADPELYIFADPPGDAWPSLHTIDLAGLESPPPRCLRAFSESLYWYGRRRLEAGHESKLSVRLPRGVVPKDMTPEAGEFMSFCTA